MSLPKPNDTQSAAPPASSPGACPKSGAGPAEPGAPGDDMSGETAATDHPAPSAGPQGAVLSVAECPALTPLLRRAGLQPCRVETGAPIPGSYWGAPEAGLIADRLYLRDDTPLHSALHEACHFICMDGVRRAGLHTDAGGDYAEEDAVCLLQILLAEQLRGVGSARMCADMDAWGYSFRLGSAAAWVRHDADDARTWLLQHGIISAGGTPTWQLRP
ncbi:MAG: hypothetical protein K9M02_14930 [Thiohalocapsa sp.]|nr:hypothetical protein [Thiohalocapsa sp.]